MPIPPALPRQLAKLCLCMMSLGLLLMGGPANGEELTNAKRADIARLLEVTDAYAMGRKTIAVMPMLFEESFRAGQLWAEMLGPQIEERVRQRLIKEGFEI